MSKKSDLLKKKKKNNSNFLLAIYTHTICFKQNSFPKWSDTVPK